MNLPKQARGAVPLFVTIIYSMCVLFHLFSHTKAEILLIKITWQYSKYLSLKMIFYSTHHNAIMVGLQHLHLYIGYIQHYTHTF